MSSTRNRNQLSDYNVKKRESEVFHRYMSNETYSTHTDTRLMELGSIPKFNGEQLAKNYVDVESMLRGIRSTNLEGPSFQAKPRSIPLEHKSWFEKPTLVIPEDHKHSFNERPLFLN